LTDEEIAYLVDTFGTARAAAAAACDTLAAKFAREVDVRVGPTSESAGDKVAHYHELGAALRGALSITAGPFLGGRSISDKQSYESDDDRLKPYFTRETFTSPH
jgi:hypothetical protein